MNTRIPTGILTRLATAVLALATAFGAGQSAAAFHVTATVSQSTVEVGDTLTVTVKGEREETDPAFVGANIYIADLWNRGGQTVQSPSITNGHMVKTWTFELVAAMPGSTTVTPVIYLGPEASLGAQVDSMVGQPVSVVAFPAPSRRSWPWAVPPIVIILVAIAIAKRRRRRQMEETYVRPQLPPLAEALEMLESIRVNQREDRATEYLADLERVILGFLTRRLGHPLTGKTAAEIQTMAGSHLPDPAVLEGLAHLMAGYSTAKYGAIRMDYDALVQLEVQAREVLERLEATWV